MDNIKFTIPGKPEYLTMVRLAIASVANNAGFDYDAIEDIKTAVEEGCKNVSCHGFDGYSERYELQCNVEKGKLEVLIKDDCASHTLEKLAKPCQNCPKEGDIGIYLIQTIMDEVDFGKTEDGHKQIRMVKNI
ncbi:MAG: ATP-binding protein [Firmicutes bacterium]|nr:ATP-binding protein [Bacillota bacterium]